MANAHISAITTCVNYSDFLTWCLMFNKHQFNRFLVVTTPQDTRTKAVCDFFNVECLQTEAFFENEQTFGKSQAINVGIQHLLKSYKTEWILHLDSDIIFPPRTVEFIKAYNLEKDSIYMADRLQVLGFDKWVDFLYEVEPVHEQEVWLRTDRFPVMPRVYRNNEHGNGIVPIGYFQLWHKNSNLNTYPKIHENAARSDMLFSLQWKPEKRKLLSTVYVWHLESQSADMGANWNGRKTKPFTKDWHKEDKEVSVDIPLVSRNRFQFVVDGIEGVVDSINAFFGKL